MVTTDASLPSGTERRLWQPEPPQLKVWQTIADAPDGSLSIIGYGGAAGGGKTRTLAELALDLCLEFPGNRVLIGRKDLTDLRTTTMEEFYAICPRQLIAKRHGSEHWCAIRLEEWPKGVVSRVFFRELKDYLSVGSEQYGAVLLEEAGEIPERSALMLLSRLRHPAATKFVFVAASNPWPGWFESWFVKHDLPEAILRDLNATITFVPAKIRDNPHIKPSPEAYEARLRALYPPDWVDRMVDGKFGVYEGQVHAELSRQRHLWYGPLPEFKMLIGGLDFSGGQNPYDHMTAGVVAGVVAAGQKGIAENNIVRFGHFEDRGPRVFEMLGEWMMGIERIMKKRVRWTADKTQSFGVDLAARTAHWDVRPSHGGPGSVELGIGLQNKRFADGSSWFTESLLEPPSKQAQLRGAQSWFSRMAEYVWEQPKDGQPAKREPRKVNDDSPNADRYMHEGIDAWPRPASLHGYRGLARGERKKDYAV